MSVSEFNGVKSTDPLDIAEKFNRFYIDSVQGINQSIDPCSDFQDSMKQYRCVFKFKKINIVQLKNIISRMNNEKDFNGINKAFILDCFEAIGDSLLDIIN